MAGRERGRARRAVARRDHALPVDAAARGRSRVPRDAPGHDAARGAHPQRGARRAGREPQLPLPAGTDAGGGRPPVARAGAGGVRVPRRGSGARGRRVHGSPRGTRVRRALQAEGGGQAGLDRRRALHRRRRTGVQLRPGRAGAGAPGGRVLPARESAAVLRAPGAVSVEGGSMSAKSAAPGAAERRVAGEAPINPLLLGGGEYPFLKLARMKDALLPQGIEPIDFSIGDPREETPAFIRDALRAAVPDMSSYPAVTGLAELRAACAGWLERRFGVRVDPETQLLPANGTKEAVFLLAFAVIGREVARDTVVIPAAAYPVYE